MPQEIIEVAQDVFRVDVEYPIPGQTCCYLIRCRNAAAIVDCGGKKGIGAVMDALAHCGIAPEGVEWLIPTHAHLDHASACGHLMQKLPNAVLAAHPATVKHLMDPNKTLVPAVRGLYGNAYFDEHYGELPPIAGNRVHNLEDNEEMLLAKTRSLRTVYSPGHAWHHLSVYDETASFLALGDAYGVSYREIDSDGKSLVVPVMPPTQFNPAAMEETIHRLHGLGAKTVGWAHFGATVNTDDLAKQQLDALATWQKQAEIFYAEARGDDFYRRMFDYILAWSLERAPGGNADTVKRRHKTDAHLSSHGFLHMLDKRQNPAKA